MADEYVTIDGQRLHWLKAIRLMREAAETARGQGEARSAVEFLMCAVRIMQERNYNAQVVEYLSIVEEIWRETHDLSQLAECLGAKAHFLEQDRKFEAALQALREVETIDRDLGSEQLEITLEQQFGIYYELRNVAEMKRVADEFFRIAKDAEAIWRIRRRLEHHGVKAGEEAAAAHSYDFGQKFQDRIRDLDQQRASEQQELAGSEAAPPSQNEIEAGEWIKKGADFSQEGKAEDAIKCFDRAIAVNPQSADAWWCKASASGSLGRYEEEIICCDKAIAIKPDYAEAWSTKAAALLQLKRYDDALSCSERALQINRELVSAWMNQGAARLGLDQVSKALRSFEKARKYGHPRAAEAISHCQRLLSESPGKASTIREPGQAREIGKHEDAKSLILKAASLREAGNYREAIACSDRALALSPDHLRGLHPDLVASIWRNKALALHALGRVDEEIAFYDQILTMNRFEDQRMEILGLRAIACMLSGRFGEAIVYFEKAKKLGDPRAAQGIALCRQQLEERGYQTGDPAGSDRPSAGRQFAFIVGICLLWAAAVVVLRFTPEISFAVPAVAAVLACALIGVGLKSGR